MGELRNKTSVKVDKADEGLDFLFALWDWPFRNSCDLHRIHLNVVIGDDDSKVFNPGFLKLTFLFPKLEFVRPQTFHDHPGDTLMFRQILGEDQDVIKIYTDHTLSNKIFENLVHHGLEGGRTVSESEVHD